MNSNEFYFFTKEAKTATKTDPAKWEAAKREAKAKMGGKHSARAMQLATQIYKKKGGGYSGAKPTSKTNSLKKWGKQKWGYSGKDKPGQGGSGVYLPEAKRKRLKSTKEGRKQLAAATRKKHKATAQGKQYSSHGLAKGTSLKKTAADSSVKSDILKAFKAEGGALGMKALKKHVKADNLQSTLKQLLAEGRVYKHRHGDLIEKKAGEGEYDDSHMLSKVLERMAAQSMHLKDKIDSGLLLPSWAEYKVYGAYDRIGKALGTAYPGEYEKDASFYFFSDELQKLASESKKKKKDPRLVRAGVSGYNQVKRTPGHPTKSHIVVAKEGDRIKTIRFGQQGVKTNQTAGQREAFKSRHAKNISRGKMSAAYWADKAKWSPKKTKDKKNKKWVKGS